MIRLKVLVVIMAFTVFAGVCLFHFYNLQIKQHHVLAAKAANQQFMTQKEHAKRGMILDRNGYPLVLSTYVYRIGMTPRDVSSRKADLTDRDIVSQMAAHLDLDDERCEAILDYIRADRVTGWMGLKKQLLGHKAQTYISIASEVPETKAMALKDWLIENGVGGIRFDAEERRVYNNQSLASPVLGMTRNEGGKLVGVSGLEAQYNALLSGEDGYLFARRNNYSSKGVIPFSTPISYPAKDSLHLVSTLDMEIQTILQEELLSVASSAGLNRGVHGLVMEVGTGDVLAMGQVGGYDAANPSALPIGMTREKWDQLSSEEKTKYLSSNLWNNINITDVYEPGSTFKAVTLAIALEENVAQEGSGFSDDPITVQGETIHCYTGGGHGNVSLRESFFYSCNPVFVQLGQRIGKSTYYDWISKFGFYDKTGIDLPAETRGILHSSPAAIDLANLTFGESSSFSAIQMARFFAMVGNGGYLVTPRVGCASTAEGLEVMQPFSVREGKKILSDRTCRRVLSMMADVVTQGTAKGTFGAIGMDIGGKTGTSRDINDRRTFSFIGLTPIQKPEYVILITIRKPETSINVSTVAARAANRVLARIQNAHDNIQHYTANDLSSLSRPVLLPEMTGEKVRDVAMKLTSMNL
ncbi:MAG TPA: penicillin-binding protein 2, partial [Bacillota bacterium]|nr:penicillin-binding protein 2 [Bacillota bacterium]